MKAKIPRAGELMNRHIHSVSPDMPLIELVDFLLKHEVSGTPVVETRQSHRFLIGFVSERDALEHLSNSMFYGSPKPPLTVETCMKRHPVTITEDVDAFALASLLVNHGYRHLPVVDSEGQLLGLVSRREVLRALRSFFQMATQEYDLEHFPPDLHQIINHRFIFSK